MRFWSASQATAPFPMQARAERLSCSVWHLGTIGPLHRRDIYDPLQHISMIAYFAGHNNRAS